MSMTATQLKSQPTVPGTYQPKGMLIGGKWVGAADPRSEGVAMSQDGKVTAITRMGMAPNRPSE